MCRGSLRHGVDCMSKQVCTEFQATKIPATLPEHCGEVLKVLDKVREERRERCALPAYRYNDETGLAPDQPPDWPPEANPDWDE
jgi:hypothetical protein